MSSKLEFQVSPEKSNQFGNKQNSTNPINKTSRGINFFGRLTNYVKSGSNKIQEKLGTFFKKKNSVPINSDKIQIQTGIGTDNKIDHNIFRIEEDENAKEFAYHLNDNDLEEEDDDDDGYRDDDEDNADIEKSSNTNIQDSQIIQNKNVESINNNNRLSPKVISNNSDSHIKKLSNKFQESNQEPINNNNLTSHRSLENSTSTTNRSNFEKEFDNGDLVDENPDPSSICHRLLFKGYSISLRDYNTVRFKKQKKKSGILSFIGFSKNKVEKNYRCFFDEYFIYFLKDVIQDKKLNEIRRLGNKYDLRMINNITLDTQENVILVSLELLKNTNTENSFVKELYFEEIEVKKFLDLLNVNLLRLNINFTSNNMQEEEFDSNENYDEENQHQQEQYENNEEEYEENDNDNYDNEYEQEENEFEEDGEHEQQGEVLNEESKSTQNDTHLFNYSNKKNRKLLFK